MTDGDETSGYRCACGYPDLPGEHGSSGCAVGKMDTTATVVRVPLPRTNIVTVESVDASVELTRVSFRSVTRQFMNDSLTFDGFVPIVPGTKLRITIAAAGDNEGHDD